MFIFITGGVRSGKSSYAEQLANKFAQRKKVIHYIATSIPYDEEMKERIACHQLDRKKQSIAYVTYEVSVNIGTIARKFQKDDVILLDCLTTLLSNELFAGWEQGVELWKEQEKREEIFQQIMMTFKELQKEAILIVVSNEVLHDIIPKEESTFLYLQMLGKLHQAIVEICDAAILVEAGIPIFKKGGVEL